MPAGTETGAAPFSDTRYSVIGEPPSAGAVHDTATSVPVTVATGASGAAGAVATSSGSYGSALKNVPRAAIASSAKASCAARPAGSGRSAYRPGRSFTYHHSVMYSL